MAQQTSSDDFEAPDLSNYDLDVRDHRDNKSGFTLELVFGRRYWYGFKFCEKGMELVAYFGSDTAHPHPHLHQKGAPEEVLDYFEGRELLGATEALEDLREEITGSIYDEEKETQLFEVDIHTESVIQCVPTRSVLATFINLASGIVELRDE